MSSSNAQDGSRDLLRKHLIKGASCQGGHSTEGQRIANILGVPFPLTMPNLASRAKKLGFRVEALWPWYEGKDKK